MRIAKERTAFADQWIQMAIALQHILDDLKQTSTDTSLWKKRAGDECVFQLGKKDCGWMISNGRLVRTTGMYCAKLTHGHIALHLYCLIL